MVQYSTGRPITPEQFRDLLVRSTLGARRPIDDAETMAGMVAHGNLCVTCWDGDLLVGIARSVTDFHYCCYLSDLAVDESYQRQGIGRELIARTKQALRPLCKLVLLSAPAATSYYPKLGFQRHASAWVLD
jgi:GNAT superfamily N-acetyltransferase